MAKWQTQSFTKRPPAEDARVQIASAPLKYQWQVGVSGYIHGCQLCEAGSSPAPADTNYIFVL